MQTTLAMGLVMLLTIAILMMKKGVDGVLLMEER